MSDLHILQQLLNLPEVVRFEFLHILENFLLAFMAIELKAAIIKGEIALMACNVSDCHWVRNHGPFVGNCGAVSWLLVSATVLDKVDDIKSEMLTFLRGRA